jgi:CheY-like chemotaxis protein
MDSRTGSVGSWQGAAGVPPANLLLPCPSSSLLGMEEASSRVVVADDNVWMATSLKVLLELWGFRVTVAHDGVAAVEAIRSVRPAVAMIDLRLPKLDGLEVARQVRAAAQAGAAPVVLLAVTASGDSSDRERTRNAGFDAHVVKPVDVTALRALLPPR